MEATTTARAIEFVGQPLPQGAGNVRATSDAGLDRLVLLAFEAADDQARDYARRVLGAAPRMGQDPGLLYLGEEVPWWPKSLPPGAQGGEVRRADNRVVKLLLAPAAGQPTRVFVAAFSQ